MAPRRKAREWAMQILYRMELNPQDAEEVFSDFWDEKKEDHGDGDFTRSLVNGVVEYKDEIDKLLVKHAANWELGRMSRIDLSAMRIALFELLHCDDIPQIVSINEAIDIAKEFGNGEKSGHFVNGILDSARKEIEKHKANC